MRAMSLQSYTLTVGLLMLGCSSSSTNEGGPSQGGSPSLGGSSNAESTTSASGGGTSNAVASSGGNTDGGSKVTGGTRAAGGNAAGGNTAGGSATGGKAAGGSATGGKAAGGNAAGGNAAGGSATGGNAAGGSATGGNAAGGSATGGNAAGGSASGGNAAGGSATGGKAAGGSATGGKAAGGATTGGSTSNACTATIPGDGCTPPAAYTNLFACLSGHSQSDTDTKVAAAWSKLFGSGSSIYHTGPGSDESYVQDTYNNDVRTEGMSYGMMIAVQLDHQSEFDRLWAFTKKHMVKGTSSISEITWSVSTSGGSNGKSGGAPDGDEYFAAALIFAHNRWGDTGKYNYATEAQLVLDLLRTKDFSSSAHLVQFYAGSGNTDGSYVLPAFYQTWACFDTANKAFWDSAVTAGRAFFQAAADKSTGVIGDQSSFSGSTTKAAGADTIRCVMNIMMDHNFYDADPWQTDTYAVKYGANQKNQNPYAAQMSCNALLGFGLPAADGKPFVDKLWSAAIPTSYWDGVLYMLAMLQVSGTFKLWY